MEAGRPRRSRAYTSSGRPGGQRRGTHWGVMKEAGAYPKKEEGRVSMKAALKHQNGCHMNQRQTLFCSAAKVRSRTNRWGHRKATFPLMSDADSRWAILPAGDWNLTTTEGAQQRSSLRAASCRGQRLAFVIRQIWIQSSLCYYLLCLKHFTFLNLVSSSLNS